MPWIIVCYCIPLIRRKRGKVFISPGDELNRNRAHSGERPTRTKQRMKESWKSCRVSLVLAEKSESAFLFLISCSSLLTQSHPHPAPEFSLTHKASARAPFHINFPLLLLKGCNKSLNWLAFFFSLLPFLHPRPWLQDVIACMPQTCRQTKKLGQVFFSLLHPLASSRVQSLIHCWILSPS